MANAAQPLLSALLAAALFGAATPLSKPLLSELSPPQLAGLLYLGAAMGVLPAVLWGTDARDTWQVPRKSVLRLAGAIAFGGVLGPVFLLLGLRLASATLVSLWLNMEVVATAVLGHLLFHDRLGLAGWLGAVGTLAAGVFLSAAEGDAGFAAALLVTLACLCWGFDNHLTALIDGMSPARATLWKGSIAGVVNLLIGANVQPFSASLRTAGLALLLGAFSYGASIVLYMTAAQRLGATRAHLLFATAPLAGVALAVGLLGESLSTGHLAAAVILGVSLLLVFRSQHTHRHAHQALTHMHAHRHHDDHHAGEIVTVAHSHWHDHEPVVHPHLHWPDLHHRHLHSPEA